MERADIQTKPFDTKKSVEKAFASKDKAATWQLTVEGKAYCWSNAMERLRIIRNGIPYGSLEVIGDRLNVSIKTILVIVGIPQTTYNLKKNKHALLNSRESELLVMIIELLDYGIEVFNKEEEKFQRWLKKPNLSLGQDTPESLLDTLTGIQEVHFCLNRLEYGNLA